MANKQDEQKINQQQTEAAQDAVPEEKPDVAAQEPQEQAAPDELPETETQESQPTAEEWKKALETAVRQRDEYLAMAQRAQADYQNFKRRNSATRADAYDDGVRETLAALLPSLDNLERAVAAAEGMPEEDPMLSGVRMTLKQMAEAMVKMGLEPVGEVGERFDPDRHNAVLRAEGEGEPGTVLEVLQKGYRVKDRMLRYAMVKIEAES